MVTVEAFQSDFATALYLIDAYLQSHGRNGWDILLFLTAGGVAQVVGELIRILHTRVSSAVEIILKWQTPHEHLLDRERFFVYSCSDALLHLDDLKIIRSTDLAENFEYLVWGYA